MSNGCCGWASKDIGKEPVEFKYSEYNKNDFFHALGELPIDCLSEEFIRKITANDEYKIHSSSDGIYRVFGTIKGLKPKIPISKPVQDMLRNLPTFDDLPPSEPLNYMEADIFYEIERRGQCWVIDVLGLDQYGVRLAANRINNRLS